jgi:hypothetical protein
MIKAVHQHHKAPRHQPTKHAVGASCRSQCPIPDSSGQQTETARRSATQTSVRPQSFSHTGRQSRRTQGSLSAHTRWQLAIGKPARGWQLEGARPQRTSVKFQTGPRCCGVTRHMCALATPERTSTTQAALAAMLGTGCQLLSPQGRIRLAPSRRG